MKFLSASLVLACISTPSFAQGSDDCNTPTLISGQGTFAYDNTLPSTGLEGQAEVFCSPFGTPAAGLGYRQPRGLPGTPGRSHAWTGGGPGKRTGAFPGPPV